MRDFRLPPARRRLAAFLCLGLGVLAGCEASRPVAGPGWEVAGEALEQSRVPGSGQSPVLAEDVASETTPVAAAVPEASDEPPTGVGGDLSAVEDSGPDETRGGEAGGEEREPADEEPAIDLPQDVEHPFPRRVEMPELPGSLEWLNTKPLKLADLRGKFVILDFWTYCCINCMHILPELKKLERAYPNELVVIGVHSAKFESEKVTDNIAAAILRYEIEHPVVNDPNHAYWETIGISSWPTVLLIDPEGQLVWGKAGEITFEEVDRVIQKGLPYYRSNKSLTPVPLRFELLAYKAEKTPLRYPGKVVADALGHRLFIADSNHNRLVVTTLDGKLLDVIGSSRQGRQDGSFAEASFDHPQGMVLHGETLYVADTENHLLRKIDLGVKRVTTIAGEGRQGRFPWPGSDPRELDIREDRRWVGTPRQTALNSPWDLWVQEGALYIAMAGPHQIWKMPLDESEIGPYAGNGREDIVDGPLLPEQPYGIGAASFAQPSGLSSDGTWLYVADSEGSSIRAVPFDAQANVRTVVGTADLPNGRLFHFGDQDGARDDVRLQHCLGVVFHEGNLYVADTYNNKIKVVDAQNGTTRTLAGTGSRGNRDEPAEFFEPGGLSLAAGRLYIADTNNHLIRTLDLATGEVATLRIEGLAPPAALGEPRKPDFSKAARKQLPVVRVRPRDGQVTLHVKLELPAGWKLNEAAGLDYWLEASADPGPLARASLGYRQVVPPASEFDVPVAVQGTGTDRISLSAIYYYCQNQDGLCLVGSVVWEVPLEVAEDGDETAVELSLDVPAPPGAFPAP